MRVVRSRIANNNTEITMPATLVTTEAGYDVYVGNVYYTNACDIEDAMRQLQCYGAREQFGWNGTFVRRQSSYMPCA